MDFDQLYIDGELKGTGLIAHPLGAVCCAPTFEQVFADQVEQLNEAELLKIAKSGKLRGDRFGDEFTLDQGSFGSCNPTAAAGCQMRMEVISGRRLTILSGAYLYGYINGGRDSGSMTADSMTGAVNIGFASLATCPRDKIHGRGFDERQAKAEALTHRGFESYPVRTRLGRFTALAKGFFLVVVVQAGSKFSRINSDGLAGVDRGSGNHAVLCEGLSAVNNELIADGRNSWGLGYGNRGRMGLTEEHFEQTNDQHVMWALRSTQGGGDEPPRMK